MKKPQQRLQRMPWPSGGLGAGRQSAAAGSGASCSPAGCLVWDQRRHGLGEPAWRQLQLGRRAADDGANCSSAGGRLMRAADATGCLLP